MDQQFLFNCWFLLLLSSVPKLVCQQKYSGNSALDCDGKDAAGPSPAFLYTCNGHKSSCKAFLIYKSQPPYNTLSRISKLTSSDCSELSRINNVSDSTRVLPTGQEVAVPVSCSCTGLYYQANSSYIAQETDSYFKIANDTYEGLSTCNMLLRENTVVESDLQAGQRIQVPLRCACPTTNGLHYLHNFTEPPYVHKDISSSNILLDADLRAKIANFSLARSAEAVLYPSSSIRLAKGTKGYLAPEYLEYGLVIPEIDVYAFGVVLTELITRKEAVFWQDEREVLLSEAIMKIVDGEDSESELCNFIDPSLHPKQKMSFVLRMVRLVLMCLAKEPEDRPSMGEIVSSLSKIQLEVYRSDFMQCSSS
ncbi:LysM domain receptor-like kinase 4 [Linum grandiflorum]